MNLKLSRNWELKKTNSSSAIKKVGISVTSIVLGLIFAGLFVLITGKDPLKLYSEILQSSVGSVYGLSETLVEMIPLALCSLGVSLAFRMQLWNIGAEGQFYMGAFGATYFALFFSNLPILILLPLMLIAGFICGGLWALIPAIPKAFWNVNETISSLLMNYVAY